MRRFKDILVHCDEGGGYRALLERVAWLAKSNEAKVTLIDVIEAKSSSLLDLFGGAQASGGPGDDIAGSIGAAYQERLDEAAQALKERGVDAATEVVWGSPTLEIIRRVLRRGHDLVMKAAQPRPDWPLLTGLDMHLIRKCPSAVWIVKSTAPAKSERILATVDPDPQDGVRDRLNVTVLQLATSLAAADEAKLDVLNAWMLHEEALLRRPRAKVPAHEVDRIVERHRRVCEERLQELVARFSDVHPAMRSLAVKGLPADVIPEHASAEGVDTIIMGTIGRTGAAGLFIGNTAETILSRVDCSVLTVKPEGFVSPVTLDD